MTDPRFEFVNIDLAASEHIAAPQYSYWKSVFRKFFSSKVAIAMLVIMAFVVIMSIVHPFISGYSNLAMDDINNPSARFLSISLEHPFGTDDVGRDMFAACWAGTRTSLFVAVIATIITNVIGTVVGMFWGFSKKLDVFMMEVYNIVANIPFTLVAMVLMFALGQGVPQLIFALSCTSWVATAYFIRVQVMIIRDREYNMASKCLGTPTFRIITHNIFPYLISVIMTGVSRDIPSFISYEVFLSYIGVGLSEKDISLGRLIENGSAYMTSAPHLFVIPVFISALISVSLYIVGQTLADASDPRTHMI